MEPTIQNEPFLPPSGPVGPHRTVSRGLTGTLRGFFFAAAAAALAAGLATFNEVRRFDEVLDRGSVGALDRLLSAEEVSAGVLGLFLLSFIVLAVLSIVWWYQAYQAIERAGVAGRSWSAGWAVGGWFIPVAQLIIPKLVFNEIDRVSGAAEEGSGEWRDRRLLGLAHWWWGLFVVGSVLLTVGTTITTDQIERVGFDAEVYRSGLWLTGAGLVADFGAALFAAASIRIVGARISR